MTVTSWQRKKLALSSGLTGIACSLLPVHPFVYGVGQNTATGSYLSPTNAINYIANKIQGAGEVDIVVTMISARTHDEFINAIQAYSGVLPLPVFSQVERMAKTAESLNITKMQIPAKTLAGIPEPQTLSTNNSRAVINAGLIEKAKSEASSGASVAGLLSSVKGFAESRKNILQGMADSLAGLLGKSTTVWVFQGKGNGAELADKMKKEIPEQDAVYTLATLFAGDIDAIKGMMHDTDTTQRK
ncbi:hypothetical protein NUITMVP1_24360 [Proteus mirabilis]|uniref:hypothetical protein n=1 Tax=Proteus mirabilis TaxID=584 RepID=UPI00220BDAFB|nr:hypothetical protein [Proteus mirabilis]BDR98527.1 hypothetical protein NUITMVP1_24360 [Proteus mirabilis]